jgi:glycosyltransferase involved in cell wall biosynthesis
MPPYDHPEDSRWRWEQYGVRLENLPVRRNDLWHQLTVPLRLAHRAVRLKPGVVHVFKPVGYGGLAGQILRSFSRLPLVLDTDDWEGRGGWADVNPYPAAWKRVFDWQERSSLRHAAAITVASRTLQTQAWGLGVDPARVVYLPNGPDPSLRDQPDFSDAQRSELRARLGVGDAPFALYLGNIPHGSDLDLAIDALIPLAGQLPQARLVIAGSGDGLPELQRRAQAAGMSGRVVFPGRIPHDQAPLYIAAADAVVNPYRDTLINRAKCSIKVVEAMALGKAVITSRVGESLQYIEDGRSGLLTEPGDVRDLARGLMHVLSDRKWAADLGRNARMRIWQRYDWDIQATEVERAYGIAAA